MQGCCAWLDGDKRPFSLYQKPICLAQQPVSVGPMSETSLFLRAAPLVFVLIWSTGWIVAGYAAPHADPLTFLCVRYACAAVLVGVSMIIFGRR